MWVILKAYKFLEMSNKVMLPLLTSDKPKIELIKVVCPNPFFPSKTINYPGDKVQFISSKTTEEPKLLETEDT